MNQVLLNFIELFLVLAAIGFTIRRFHPRAIPSTISLSSAHPLRGARIIFWKVLFWIPTSIFLAASVIYGAQTRMLLNEVRTQPHGLYCANTVTGSLTEILNFGAPLSFLGVVGFICLSRYGVPSIKSIVAISVLNLTCTALLVRFGIAFFGDNLSPFTLSQSVWWLPARI